MRLFKLDGCRGFGGVVKEDAVDIFDLVDDAVGVMGDERTYDYAIALRAVTTTDFMTAEVTILPTETITTALPPSNL